MYSILSFEQIRLFPKAELHVHLDGCVRPATARELAAQAGIPLPDDLQAALVAPPVCDDLGDYLTRFTLPLQLMQTESALERIAYELVEDWATDGVIYGEVRWAPQLHTRQGVTFQAAVDAVAHGLERSENDFGVRCRQIVCCLRHQSPQVSQVLAELAIDNRRNRVAALDLAGDEARYRGAPHQPAFDLARRAGLSRTVHAGEAAGAPSIHEALDLLGAQRLGHGVRLAESGRLVERARTARIPLEMCPTSNYQTRAVNGLDHPADRYLRAGLAVTISTDGRTVSDTTVSREYAWLAGRFGWGVAEMAATVRHALDGAFVSELERAELTKLFEERLTKINQC
jgi:adenosine deaminase